MSDVGLTDLDALGRRARRLTRAAVAALTLVCLAWVAVVRVPEGALPAVGGVVATLGFLASTRVPVVAVAVGLVDLALFGPDPALFLSSIVLTLRSADRPVLRLAVASVAGLVAVHVGPAWLTADRWDATLTASVLVLTPGLVGLALRWRSARERLRGELADERVRAAELDVRNAEISTRLQIAREMHDGLGHHLSLLVLGLSGVDGLIGTDDERARDLLHEVQDLGRSAMTELRDDVVGGLGAGEADGAVATTGGAPPASGATTDLVAPVRTIVDRARRAGIDVDLDAPPTVPAGAADHALVERVVTEALTNVAKHAPGARTRVVLTATDGAVRVVVTNGAPTTTPPAPPVSGTGLRALADTLGRSGATLESGASPDGGFRLAATLPGSRSTQETLT